MNRYIQLKGFILYKYNVASKDFFRFGAKKPKPGIIGSCGVTIGMRGVYILCVTCVCHVWFANTDGYTFSRRGS